MIWEWVVKYQYRFRLGFYFYFFLPALLSNIYKTRLYVIITLVIFLFIDILTRHDQRCGRRHRQKETQYNKPRTRRRVLISTALTNNIHQYLAPVFCNHLFLFVLPLFFVPNANIAAVV